jgi:hypothetical protein
VTKNKTQENGVASKLPLHEIVAVATFLAGADRQAIDTEDIAVKANEIAPGHFSWRKYKNQIRIDAIYKLLWGLTKHEKGAYVTGSEKDGWLLTVAGTEFAQRTLARLKDLQPARTKPTQQEAAWMRRERARMLSETAFLKCRAGKSDEISDNEAQKFFRLDDYVIGAARERKLMQAENTFHDDSELSEAVLCIAAIVRGSK